MISHDLQNSTIKRGVSNSVDPDQGRRSVGPGLDPDCLHVNSLNISEEMLGASQKLSLTAGQTDRRTSGQKDG